MHKILSGGYMDIQKLKKLLFRTIIIVISFYANTAFAAQPTLSNMLANFATTMPNLMRLVTATAYVIGMYFVVKGVAGLRTIGQQTQQGTIGLKPYLILILIGAALMYLPSTVQTVNNTLFSDANISPIAYIFPDKMDEWPGLINICSMIMRLVGTISFVKGLVTLNRNHPAQDGQPSSFSRGIAHLIGGALCINIYNFVPVIWNTLGLN